MCNYKSLCLLLLALAIMPVFGQNRNTGEIKGTVQDASGAVIPGVAVTVTNTLTGISKQVSSGESGVYQALFLSPGNYSIEFVADGFKKLVRNGITLNVETIAVNATLELGAVTQEISVTADVPLVQTESAERRETLDSNAVKELPIVGRSWYELTALAPGVNPGRQADSNGRGGQAIGVNGSTQFTQNWLIDGGVGTFPVSQNPDFLTVPLEAIQEVSLNTSSFSAEYGNGTAVFNVISKSGTNEFHGSAFWYVQNDKLDARNFFFATKSPRRWNQYGGTIGGPIKKNKAFFFFSYQRTSIRNPGEKFFTFPSPALRNGDFSGPGLPVVYDPFSLSNGQRTPLPGNQMAPSQMDPVAINIQNQLPLPDNERLFDNFFFSSSSPNSLPVYNVKSDINVSEAHRVMVSYMLARQTNFNDSPTCPMNCVDRNQPEQAAQLSWTWTARPTVINEFRSSFIRTGGLWSTPSQFAGWPEKIGLKNLPVDAFPDIRVRGTTSTSIAGGLRAQLGFNSFVQSNMTTIIKGKHTIKFGGEFNKWQQNIAWADMNPGRFNLVVIYLTHRTQGGTIVAVLILQMSIAPSSTTHGQFHHSGGTRCRS